MSNINDTTVQVNSAFSPDETLGNNNAEGNMQEKKPNAGAAQKPSQVEEGGCNTACTKILVVVLAAIFIAFLIVLVLYVREKDSTKTSIEQRQNKTKNSPTTSFETCFEEHCIIHAADLLSYMNRSVDPCEDFYSFSCGGWEKKTFMPTTTDQIHVLWSLTNSNRQFVKNVIGKQGTREKYAKNRAVIKSIDLYQTCLSKNTINQQDDTHLKEIIKDLGGSNLTTADWNSTYYDLDKVMLTTFGQLGIQPFFSLNVFADFINSSIRRFGISDGGIVLANTFYVEKNSTEEFYSKTRNAYRQYMVDVMTAFGVDEQEAKRQMAQVYLFEESIAEAIKNNNGRPSMTNLETLSNYTNFDWFEFLSKLTANQTYKLTKNENILVRTSGLLKDVMALIKRTNKVVLSNYVAWTIIQKVIDHLPERYRDVRLAYEKRINGETYEADERWITCYETTNEAFPMSIGLMFVDEKLSEQARARAREIFEEIKREFVRGLDSQTWMDEKTRTNAKEKAKAMTLLVGYPDYIKDEEKLNAKYENVQVNNENYLQTIINIRKFAFQKKIAELKRPVDRTTFDISPANVNAFHYRQENKNVFLAGILQPPFYGENRFRASNYGGIGVVAGHELSHGFDQNGRSYNKYGNFANWWTKNSSDEYVKKSKCLEDQYSQFELYGKKVNGELTLGENTADNGGLKFAFEAYKRWVEQHGEENKLPGLEFTPYQLFFISYGQGWCSKYTLQGALNQVDNQVWPPMNIRVRGAVMNSEAFAEAFECKPGTPMNPVKKCSLW